MLICLLIKISFYCDIGTRDKTAVRDSKTQVKSCHKVVLSLSLDIGVESILFHKMIQPTEKLWILVLLSVIWKNHYGTFSHLNDAFVLCSSLYHQLSEASTLQQQKDHTTAVSIWAFYRLGVGEVMAAWVLRLWVVESIPATVVLQSVRILAGAVEYMYLS